MPAFKVTTSNNEKELLVRVSGDLDEDAILEPIHFDSFDHITIDLSEIGSINSCGIRLWLGWASQFPVGKTISLVRCPKMFVDSANMIRDFVPAHWIVRSVELPYFCDSCSEVTSIYFEPQGDSPPEVSEAHKCGHCGEQAELDVFPENYLRIFRKRAT